MRATRSVFDNSLTYFMHYLLQMCISLHYFYVACGHQLAVHQGRHPSIAMFARAIPYVQIKERKE